MESRIIIVLFGFLLALSNCESWCFVEPGAPTTTTYTYRSSFSIAANNGSLFVASGFQIIGGTYFDYPFVDIFDMKNQTWSKAGPIVGRASSVSVAVKDLIVIAGGATNQYDLAWTNLVDIYNTTSKTWSNNTLPDPIYLPTAISVGKYALFTLYSPSDQVLIYDSEFDTFRYEYAYQQSGVYEDEEYFFQVSSSAWEDLAIFAGGISTKTGQESTYLNIWNSTSGNWSRSSLPTRVASLGVTAIDDMWLRQLRRPRRTEIVV